MHSFAFWVSFLCLIVSRTYSRSFQGIAPKMDVRNNHIFKTFETKFLAMMGLKEKPRVKRDTVVPQYMLDLYNSQVEDENYITTNLAFKDFATTANTVRSFYHADVRYDAYGISNSSKKQVLLDITSVPSHEQLVKAEFRLYRNISGNLQYPKHIISVYQILQPGVGEESVKRLLDSRVVDATSHGWDSYDIFKAVQDWRDKPSQNHGLEIQIMSQNGNPIDISHLRFGRQEELDENKWPHHRPLLAVYTRDPNTHHHEVRTRRSSRHRGGRVDHCKRHGLTVDFQKLNWHTWVVAPPQYEAYYCKGDCVYPLTEHMNTTNHAIVQTLVHNVRKFRDTVPPACCIPTSFESLSMLYLSEKQPVIKKFKQMIVTGCGCR